MSYRDPNQPLPRFCEITHLGFRLLQVAIRQSKTCDQSAACISQLNAACSAFKQSCGKPGLQPLHCPAKRRLRYAYFFGSPRKRMVDRYLDQIAQISFQQNQPSRMHHVHGFVRIVDRQPCTNTLKIIE